MVSLVIISFLYTTKTWILFNMVKLNYPVGLKGKIRVVFNRLYCCYGNPRELGGGGVTMHFFIKIIKQQLL